MYLALVGVMFFAAISAAVQAGALLESAAAPPVSPGLRLVAQAILFVPAVISAVIMQKQRIAAAVLGAGAVLYAHLPSPFFDYVWDVFLIETIFVWLASSVLLSKPEWRRWYLWPMRFLLFKLMFCMGVVKFLHGMPEWKNGLAMKFFWANQPMPGLISWYAAQLPDWVQRIMTGFVFIVEVPGPFLIFLGNKARRLFFFLNLLLQIGIFVSGNYGFFNILTIITSLALFELKRPEIIETAMRLPKRVLVYATTAALIGWGLCSLWYIYRAVSPGTNYLHETSWIFLKNEGQREVTAPARGLLQFYAAAKVANPYALFGIIPKYRMEIAIEGSADAVAWKQYAFRIKPAETKKAPAWYAPHHWRLDHQMYYESFRIRDTALHERHSYFLGVRWMPHFLGNLLNNQSKTCYLLKECPFAEPPRFLRLRYLYYSFTNAAEKSATGEYWKTEAPHAGQFHEAIINRENYLQLP